MAEKNIVINMRKSNHPPPPFVGELYFLWWWSWWWWWWWWWWRWEWGWWCWRSGWWWGSGSGSPPRWRVVWGKFPNITLAQSLINLDHSLAWWSCWRYRKGCWWWWKSLLQRQQKRISSLLKKPIGWVQGLPDVSSYQTIIMDRYNSIFCSLTVWSPDGENNA